MFDLKWEVEKRLGRLTVLTPVGRALRYKGVMWGSRSQAAKQRGGSLGRSLLLGFNQALELGLFPRR